MFIQNDQKLRFLYPGFFPDAGIRILGELSGFLKSTYLDSTCSGEFLDAKIFLDKFCPGSGFALNQSISDIFLSISLMITQNDLKLRFFMTQTSPGYRNPDFGYTVRFFKKYIFGFYMLWGVSGCKNFPRQISSRIRFCPKLAIFRHFGLLWISIACLGLFCVRVLKILGLFEISNQPYKHTKIYKLITLFTIRLTFL